MQWRGYPKMSVKLKIQKNSLQVVIPVFGDQPANGLEAERRGYGISIPLPDLTSENLFEAVSKILTDPKYTLKAQEHGQLVMDELTTPLERAIWWIEYAIRYPGMHYILRYTVSHFIY